MIKQFLDKHIEDVKKGLSTLPCPSDFFFCVIVFVIYAICSLAIIFRTKSFNWSPAYFSFTAAFLAFLPLTIHSFIEEVIFRGILIPHKSRKIAKGKILSLSVISISLFIIWHPIMALSFAQSTHHIFMNPAFLAVVALMATASTITYLKSGSLWVPIFIHWTTLFVWVYGVR